MKLIHIADTHLGLAAFSASVDPGRVRARARKFGLDLIAVPLVFKSRPPAPFELNQAIRVPVSSRHHFFLVQLIQTIKRQEILP